MPFHNVEVKYGPESGRQSADHIQNLLVSQLLYGRGVPAGKSPCLFHVLAFLENILFAQTHKSRVDKDLAGPTLERAVSRITVELGEQVYKTVLQYIFRNIPVSHITETNGIHFAAQIVVD